MPVVRNHPTVSSITAYVSEIKLTDTYREAAKSRTIPAMALKETGASGARSDSAKQPHMPKLTYRSNSIKVPTTRDSSTTVSTSTISLATPSTAPTTPRFSTSTKPSLPRLPSDRVSPTSGRFPVDALQEPKSPNVPLSSAKNSTNAGRKEKKGGSFFNFLSVKEPSAQAFEEYQNQMRKKTQGRKGRPSAVGMPGVSSAKLPPTVPKVNTRWDGVPQALKEKEKEKDKSKDPPRLSVSAGSKKPASSRPGQLSRSGTSHSASSTSSGNRLADLYGWSTPSSSSGSIAKDFALEHNKPKKTPSTTTLPETTLFATHPRLPPRSVSEQSPPLAELSDDIPPVPELPFSPAPYPELPPDSYLIPELPGEPAPMPELPANPIPLRAKPQERSSNPAAFMRTSDSMNVGQLTVSPLRLRQHPVSVLPPPRNPLRPPPVPELEGDLTDYSKTRTNGQSPLPSPDEWSPVTPSGPNIASPLPKTSDFQVDSDTISDIKQTIIEVPTGADEVIVVSSGINILGPPVSARRAKQQAQRPQADSRQGFLAGEAKELIIPDESLPHSILKKGLLPAKPLASSHFSTPGPKRDLVPGGATLRDKLGFGSESKSLSPHALADGFPIEAQRIITPTRETAMSGTMRRKRGRVHR